MILIVFSIVVSTQHLGDGVIHMCKNLCGLFHLQIPEGFDMDHMPSCCANFILKNVVIISWRIMLYRFVVLLQLPTIWTPLTNWVFLHSKDQPKLSIGIFTVISKHKDDRHDTHIFHHHQSIQGFRATKSHMIHALILINNWWLKIKRPFASYFIPLFQTKLDSQGNKPYL